MAVKFQGGRAVPTKTAIESRISILMQQLERYHNELSQLKGDIRSITDGVPQVASYQTPRLRMTMDGISKSVEDARSSLADAISKGIKAKQQI